MRSGPAGVRAGRRARAVDLLRRLGSLIEPEVTTRGGAVVKRLGDGLMAVFPDPADAVTHLWAEGHP